MKATKPKPTRRTPTTTFALSPETRDRLRQMADADRRTMSGQIEWMVDQVWKVREATEVPRQPPPIAPSR